MPEPAKTMTAADEARAYMGAEPRPKMFGGGLVAQLLAEHDEQRDRADKAEAEAAMLRAQMATLDDCLTATAEAKGSSRYAGQGRLITLLMVDDVREMISEWRKAGGDDA